MTTKRTKRTPAHNRVTPEIVGAIAEGCTGVELDMLLGLRRGETLVSVTAPIARAALAVPPERLQEWLGRRIRDGELETLARWAGEKDRPPPIVEEP